MTTNNNYLDVSNYKNAVPITMHLPTLPLSNNSHVYVEGDVSIDPSAAIAAGVILRAAPEGKITIASGVCIGMGSILHAYQSSLEVGVGANLGAGVLIVGDCTIGANACIGSATTIWNSSIDPGVVVAAGSVVGEKGRQIAEVSSPTTTPPVIDTTDKTSPTSNSTTDKNELNGQTPAKTAVESPSTNEDNSPTPTQTQEESNSDTGTAVYGQGNLNRLLKTLFPYNNQSLNPSSEDT
jgi:carbon dioxide concentrating mechanism protein CcmN